MEFTDEESFSAMSEETGMFCSYKGYDSGYETENSVADKDDEKDSEDSDENEDIEEIQMDEEPNRQAGTLTPPRERENMPESQITTKGYDDEASQGGGQREEP